MGEVSVAEDARVGAHFGDGLILETLFFGSVFGNEAFLVNLHIMLVKILFRIASRLIDQVKEEIETLESISMFA